MPADVTLRPGTAGDTGRILDLVRLSLGEGGIPRDPGFWEWKHRASPFGPSPVLLAEVAGELVGLRVFLPWTWQSGDRTLSAVRAVDTATHPDWRGKGIFTRLTRALLERVRGEGIAFVFNTPNARSRPGYLKMGWRVVGRAGLSIRPLRPVRTARALLPLGGSAASNGDAGPQAPPGDPVAHLLDDPRLPTFLRGLCTPPAGLWTVPTPQYLRWRYADVPGFDYRAMWAFDQDEGGLVIFRHKERGALRELRVCEVLVGPGARSSRMASGLLREASRASDADFASIMVGPGSPGRGASLRAGFVPVPRIGPIVTALPLAARGAGPDVLARSAWACSTGDLELF